jgi:hypothetical protein
MVLPAQPPRIGSCFWIRVARAGLVVVWVPTRTCAGVPTHEQGCIAGISWASMDVDPVSGAVGSEPPKRFLTAPLVPCACGVCLLLRSQARGEWHALEEDLGEEARQLISVRLRYKIDFVGCACME